MLDKHKVKKLIETHIAKTIGCTDIGVVGYIASIGAYVLRHKKIKNIHLLMSDELYKNSVNVGVPGMRKSGLTEALALGILLKNPKEQLSVFETVTNDDIAQIDALLKDVNVSIQHQKFPDTVLYEALTITSEEGDVVEIIIKDYYDNVVSVIKNGEKLPEFEKTVLIGKVTAHQIEAFDDVYDFVIQGDFEDLDTVFDIAKIQYESARAELKLLNRPYLVEDLPGTKRSCSYDLSAYLKEHIEVSSKKRMIGDIFTVYGVAGSGNLGIGTFITPMFLKDALNLSDHMAKQLIILSFLTSVYVKQSMNIVTVLCGTGHATGCSAAACYTLAKGGTNKDIKDAMNLYLSSSMGFVCDGAKVSCTYKVSFAAMNGLIASQMVLAGDISHDGLGLNKMDVDQTIKNLGKLNNEILDSANKGIISLI
jgi:L-cysteine desulfidase